MTPAKRVVLIQNDAYLIETRKQILERQGYKVEAVHTVEEARAICGEIACDLVIVDSEEDHLAALSLCDEIKAENPDVSVAVMTWDATEFESDCPDAVIRRKKGPQELLDKVEAAIG